MRWHSGEGGANDAVFVPVYKGPFLRLWDWLVQLVCSPVRKAEVRKDVESAASEINEDKSEHQDELREGEQSAPNILLNLHQGSRTRDLVVAAISGVVLQVGVLIFSAFTTYRTGFNARFQKAGYPVRGYAYPTMAVGTVILVLGMMLCSFVIEKSTEEREWIAGKKYPSLTSKVRLIVKIQEKHQSRITNSWSQAKTVKARIIWLQKKHYVSDQSFDSFVLCAEEDCDKILTSRRLRPRPHHTFDALRNIAPKAFDALGKIAPTYFEALTVVGAVIGLAGFILQFEGLYAMNWTDTIAQLVATFLMTVMRAWVRRGLISEPQRNTVLDQHEMDWLALRLATGKYPDSSIPPKPLDDWEIVAGAKNQAHPGSFAPRRETLRPDQKAQKAMKIRQRLGQLTGWLGQASKEAISVATAIEIVMNTFWGEGQKEGQTFTWTLNVEFGVGEGGHKIKDEIEFTIKWGKFPKAASNARREQEAWHVNASAIESALSLWIFHFRQKAEEFREERRKAEDQALEDQGLEQKGNRDWLRKGGLELGWRFRQVLGPDSEALRRDLQWWVGDKVARESQETESPTRSTDPTDLPIGFSGLSPASSKPSTPLSPMCMERFER